MAFLRELENLGWRIVKDYKEAEFVIVGLDREVTYEKLKQAVFGNPAGCYFHCLQQGFFFSNS